MKMHVWTDRFSFLAVAHSDSVEASRKMLLEGSLGKSGDGSCPERDKARRIVLGETPEIWQGPNEEFVLTDSADLREMEGLLQTKDKEISTLRAAVRNQRGDDLCWINNPENAEIAKALPEAEFLESCRRYRQQLAAERGEFTGCRTIAQLEAVIVELEEQLATALRTSETVESVTGLPSTSNFPFQHDPITKKEGEV